MSRRDIVVVCELAAHLMVAGLPPGVTAPHHSAPRVASDAMRLQKLGRRAQNMETKACNVPGYFEDNGYGEPKADCLYQLEHDRITVAVENLLAPYGLGASIGGDPRGCCLHIIGLPGNTPGGDTEGFGI